MRKKKESMWFVGLAFNEEPVVVEVPSAVACDADRYREWLESYGLETFPGMLLGGQQVEGLADSLAAVARVVSGKKPKRTA